MSEIRKESENLQHIEEGRFTIYAVDKNCELSSLIVKHNLTYRIGGVYYEFARNEEDVTEDKGVILMDKVCTCDCKIEILYIIYYCYSFRKLCSLVKMQSR